MNHLRLVRLTIVTMLLLTFSLNAQQTLNAGYTIQTSAEGDTTTVFYENNKGMLSIDVISGDITFTADLARIKTGNDTIDSLLANEGQVRLVFQANTGQHISDLMKKQNDDIFYKIAGTVLVNNVFYPVQASVKFKNMAEKTDIENILISLSFEIDPKIIKIPYLSDFFKKQADFPGG